jgi:pilus assembly protein CpaF
MGAPLRSAVRAIPPEPVRPVKEPGHSQVGLAGKLRGTWSDALVGALSPIIGLLADEHVTEVEANAFNEIWVKGQGWRGHRRVDGIGWADEGDFLLACVRIGEVIGRTLSKRTPLLNGRLPGGERVNVAIPPACERIALTIRKFPAETMSFEILERKRSVDGTVRAICEALVLGRQSILVAGGTGAGKTSLLNALSLVIPAHERIITIEDARELQIQQENWVAMETVEPYEAGAHPVTIGDLVRNALRQTPDRIVVGEVRGEEAFYLLRAFSSGHGGGFGTIHSNDAEDGLHQLQLLAQMAPIAGLTAQVVAAMVGRAVDLVIYQRLFESTGDRRVAEIIELEKPGVTYGAGGEIGYRFRRLVEWSAATGTWIFPAEPSPRLRMALQAAGCGWPRDEERTDVDGIAP